MRSRSCFEFHLPLKKRHLWRKLKKEEEKIFRKYPPYSPAHPGISPMRDIRNLYNTTDPDVLYFYFLKLNKSCSSFSNLSQVCISFVAGLLSSAFVAYAGEVLEFSSYFYAMGFSIVFSFAVLLLLFLYFHFMGPACYDFPAITEEKIKIMRQILRIDEYLSPM